MKCHMEYEEGTPFCSNCGGALVVKEKPKSEKKDHKKGEKGKADGKLVCPKCNILYEKMSSCIRCGTPLVTQSALKEMKESQPPLRLKVKLKKNPLPLHPRKDHQWKQKGKRPNQLMPLNSERSPLLFKPTKNTPSKNPQKTKGKESLSKRREKKAFSFTLWGFVYHSSVYGCYLFRYQPFSHKRGHGVARKGRFVHFPGGVRHPCFFHPGGSFATGDRKDKGCPGKYPAGKFNKEYFPFHVLLCS